MQTQTILTSWHGKCLYFIYIYIHSGVCWIGVDREYMGKYMYTYMYIHMFWICSTASGLGFYSGATYASLMFPLLDTANFTEEGHLSTHVHIYIQYTHIYIYIDMIFILYIYTYTYVFIYIYMRLCVSWKGWDAFVPILIEPLFLKKTFGVKLVDWS